MPGHRLVPALALAVLAWLPSAVTEARGIRVDAGAGGYEFSGQAWQLEVPLGAGGVLAGTLPFAINFGAGSVTGFCMFGNGTIGFASNCGAVPPNALLQPLAANWLVDPAATRIFEEGSATYTAGRLARTPPFPPDPNDAPLAVRFHWNDVECDTCGGFSYSFQAILIDMGNGDFDLELNYGDVPAGVGLARFLLGSNQFQSGGPFPSSVNFDFQFRNGALVNGPGPGPGPGGVPEPGILALLGIALVSMRLATRRA